MQILVLEASTTSAKAMLYDQNLGIVDIQVKAYSDSINANGTHDVDGLFYALMDIGRQVAAGHDIAAVALIGTWHSLLVCNANLEPITRCFTWVSTMGNEITKQIRQNNKLVSDLYSSTGCMVNTTYPLYKLMHLSQNGMDLSNCRIMGENDYIFYRLTGEIATSISAASGSGFLNIRELKWNDLSTCLSGIKKEQLPPIYDYGMSAPLRQDIAERLNIAAGIPVTIPQADGAMNHLGAGALRPGIMTLSVGTSAAARMIRSKPEAMASEGTWCYYAPTSWLGGVATAGATSCLDWFMHHMAGEISYKEFEDDLIIEKDSPYFLPFLFGERCPGWNDTRYGGFHCLRSKHGKQALYGAILEGVLYNLFHAYQYLVKASGTPTTILISGGITNSTCWMQMIADIWQQSFTIRRDTSQASMLGGAAIAMHVLDELPDVTTFNIDYKNSVPINPRSEMANFYAERFAGYKMLYNLDDRISFK